MPIRANAPKGADAKPWVYGSPSYDRQATDHVEVHMTATLQPGSGLTKQSAELGRVPFLPASTPARTRPDTAKPPGLCDASGGLAELGLPTRMLLAIPELGS